MTGKGYDRGTGKDQVRILHQNHELVITESKLLQLWNAQTTIRIENNDYPESYEPGQTLIHFGLPVHNEQAEMTAVLARIMEHGSFTKGGSEKLPLLSFENVWICTINSIIESISYENLPKDCFDNTIGNITSVDDLKKAILSRYTPVLVNQTPEEILSRGVSIRYLKLNHKVSFDSSELNS